MEEAKERLDHLLSQYETEKQQVEETLRSSRRRCSEKGHLRQRRCGARQRECRLERVAGKEKRLLQRKDQGHQGMDQRVIISVERVTEVFIVVKNLLPSHHDLPMTGQQQIGIKAGKPFDALKKLLRVPLSKICSADPRSKTTSPVKRAFLSGQQIESEPGEWPGVRTISNGSFEMELAFLQIEIDPIPWKGSPIISNRCFHGPRGSAPLPDSSPFGWGCPGMLPGLENGRMGVSGDDEIDRPKRDAIALHLR